MSAFVLTFTKNDQTLIELCTLVIQFGSDTCRDCTGQHQKCLENVRHPTFIISCSAMVGKNCQNVLKFVCIYIYIYIYIK